MSIVNIIAGDEEPSKVYRRLAYLVVGLATLVILLSMYVSTQKQIDTSLQSYSKSLGRDIALQYAELLIPALEQKDDNGIQLFLTSLVSQSHILSGSVFNQYGELLSQQPTQQNILSIYQGNKQDVAITFIQEIRKDESMLGYLRIVFDHSEVINKQDQLNQIYQTQTKLLMLLSLILGVVVTRKIYVFRMRKYYRKRQLKSDL